MTITISNRTTKGERTRQHLYDTAIQLFLERGYGQTTMRDIAAAAECSLGLTYRYFSCKEELIQELYQQLSLAMEADVQKLPATTIAARFDAIMQAMLVRLTPYRPLLGAVMGSALTPQHEVAVLGPGSAAIRQRSEQVFRAVVQGANDAPRPQQAADLATLLYAAHYGVMLFWFNDRSENQRLTGELLAFTSDILRLARRVLRVPWVGGAVSRLAKLIGPVLGSGL